VTRCKGCGQEYRKGTRAFLLTASGLQGVRVCPACARRGILLVAVKHAAIVKQAAARPEGVARVLRLLRTYAAAERSAAKEPGMRDVADGRAQGFEGAIVALKREWGLE
jgi:hypothetical protein